MQRAPEPLGGARAMPPEVLKPGSSEMLFSAFSRRYFVKNQSRSSVK